MDSCGFAISLARGVDESFFLIGSGSAHWLVDTGVPRAYAWKCQQFVGFIERWVRLQVGERKPQFCVCKSRSILAPHDRKNSENDCLGYTRVRKERARIHVRSAIIPAGMQRTYWPTARFTSTPRKVLVVYPNESVVFSGAVPLT